MAASPGSDAAAQEVMRRKIAGGSDAASQEATKLAERKWDLTSQSPSVASQASPGQSLLRKGQFRLRRLNKKTRKSVVERFALLTREEREPDSPLARPVTASSGEKN
ncbi:hypothetical protein V511_11585 [Mesotoga sp. Brook.08.YT.4.2.5.1]|uniref:hypothetical protein n=1 Tax=Mesotoga sp. Brook.08.YT.4.2.5.1 TaxID=1421001 RepID=UPI000C9C5144|nr:hypothetical protein [Mesotoga sp. Brook.08.YT.4.2.5.1]PNE19901.1 hypothetical protein V511_11585 [Mesotoga sp. Brook.08.YT.4.2.5.1]